MVIGRYGRVGISGLAMQKKSVMGSQTVGKFPLLNQICDLVLFHHPRQFGNLVKAEIYCN